MHFSDCTKQKFILNFIFVLNLNINKYCYIYQYIKHVKKTPKADVFFLIDQSE